MKPGWNFETSYVRLPESLFVRVNPTAVRNPHTVIFNESLARSLGLDVEMLSSERGAAQLSGNELPEGADPIAQAYAGHQFGHFTTLGDGRAILLGEQLTPDGARIDIQLKGAGRTPYSRRGDGRAALGPMLREYIISEAMHAFGIPTTRSLAVVATGEPVFRESILQGAVLARTAASHLRVGTFEYLAARGKRDELEALADHAIDRHYPDLKGTENRHLRFFDAVLSRQASLVAKWMGTGFIHGVMNTDNMSIAGETIDYGPCAFMDTFDQATVFSSIDRDGRYAYGAQPGIAQWNLARLAEALLPLLSENEDRAIELAGESLSKFPMIFGDFWLSVLREKLGLGAISNEKTLLDQDAALARDFLVLLEQQRADLTRSFRALGAETHPDEPLFSSVEFQAWNARWEHRLSLEKLPREEIRKRMRLVNPAVIPRNHKVEEALAAAESGDLIPLRRLLAAVSRPFDEVPENEPFLNPPPAGSEPYRTFCGT